MKKSISILAIQSFRGANVHLASVKRHLGTLNSYFAVLLMASLAVFTSCKNDDIEFGDFDYQTIYFATQTPVRTITLGEDTYPTESDNEHRFQVYATLGGVENNKSDRTVNIVVDETLVDGLVFDDGSVMKALPADYYKLSGNTITIKSGNIMGCVDVQLTDAFFADPKSTELTYVLPLRIVSASDSVLSGMDYTLYAVKYKNKYHGCWLSRGTDLITTGGKDSTNVRMPDDWEDADLVYLTTVGLQQSRYEVSTNVWVADEKGNTTVATKKCSLILTFDDEDNCTITTDTEGCTATGSGKWTYHGEPKAWNKTDRDQLKLDYTVTFTYQSGGEDVTTTVKTTETLVMRDRQNKYETFTYTTK